MSISLRVGGGGGGVGGGCFQIAGALYNYVQWYLCFWPDGFANF